MPVVYSNFSYRHIDMEEDIFQYGTLFVFVFFFS